MPRSKAFQKLVAVAAWITFAFIVFSTLSPPISRPTILANPNVERFAAFALLGLLFGLAYARRLAAYSLFIILTAGTLETLQLLIHDRHGHLLDALVKAAGGLVSIGLAFVMTMTDRRRASISSFHA